MQSKDYQKLLNCPFCGGEVAMQAPNMHRKTCVVCKECGVSTGWGAVDTITSVWNRRAQHMPTVDTVEVTRCRDCVHFGECLVTENDYCSKGERKETD